MPAQSIFSFPSFAFQVATTECMNDTLSTQHTGRLKHAKLSANSPPSFASALRRMVKQGLPVSLGMPTRRQALLRCSRGWFLPRCSISVHSLTDACLRTLALQLLAQWLQLTFSTETHLSRLDSSGDMTARGT